MLSAVKLNVVMLSVVMLGIAPTWPSLVSLTQANPTFQKHLISMNFVLINKLSNKFNPRQVVKKLIKFQFF